MNELALKRWSEQCIYWCKKINNLKIVTYKRIWEIQVMNYLMSMNHLHNNFPSNLNHDILNHDILFAFQRVKNYLNLLQIYNYINESLYRLPTSKSKYPCWSINCLYCWILLRVALVTSMKHERFRKDTIDSVTFFSGQIWWLSQRASTAGAPFLMSTKSFWFSIWSVAGNKN